MKNSSMSRHRNTHTLWESLVCCDMKALLLMLKLWVCRDMDHLFRDIGRRVNKLLLQHCNVVNRCQKN